MRVIKKNHVADSIAKYDYEVKIIYSAEALYTEATAAGIAASRELLDYGLRYDSSYFKNDELTGKALPLLTDDIVQHRKFFNKIDYEKAATDNYIRNLQTRLPFLRSLILFLKKVYSLE